MAEVLRDALFYVVPRISPDGAEAVLKQGRYVRSSPIDKRLHKGHAYWESFDFDENGHIGYMRKADPDGELVELADHPGVMVPRLPEDPPPYYKLYPEGRIANFDGRRIPDPYFLSDNQYDFNRNFPYSWAPEHEQEGAGIQCDRHAADGQLRTTDPGPHPPDRNQREPVDDGGSGLVDLPPHHSLMWRREAGGGRPAAPYILERRFEVFGR